MNMNLVAYAAGVIEGEGSFMTTTNGYSPRVQVSMTDKDVLEQLQKTFGCGTIHAITKREEHWKDAWVWRCSGNEALRVMEVVYPYMGLRRKAKIEEVRGIWLEKLDV